MRKLIVEDFDEVALGPGGGGNRYIAQLMARQACKGYCPVTMINAHESPDDAHLADILILQSEGCHFRDCVEVTHLRAVGHHKFIEELTQAQVFPWGEQHWNAKLTESQALTIRANAATSAQDLARQFGVSVGTINAIRSRRRWAHLDQENGPGDVPRAPGRRPG